MRDQGAVRDAVALTRELGPVSYAVDCAGVDGIAAQTPLGRLAEVGEVAEPVVFLLGDQASFVTGTDLLDDGGFRAW